MAAPAGRAVDLVRASQWIKRRNAPATPKPLVFQCRLLAMTPWLAGADRPSSIVAPMATVGQQPQRRPGGPSGSPRPRTELSENGIGDGGQVAAPAGRAVDLIRWQEFYAAALAMVQKRPLCARVNG